MNESHEKKPAAIPVLTEVADDAIRPKSEESAQRADDKPVAPLLDENRLAELQTELASRSFELTDRLLHSAFQEMEASLFELVSNRLRNELPEMIDRILRDYLDTSTDSDKL